MLDTNRDKLAFATRKARDKFSHAAEREAEFLRDRQKTRDAEATKTAHLRELRMAKEAADKEAAAVRTAEKNTARKTKSVKAKAEPAQAGTAD
jgi:hypothetical protein